MRRPAGQAPDGSAVEQIILSGGGLTAQVLTWGATVQGLWLEGLPHSLLLGSPRLGAYFHDLLYFGAIVGPVANRISGPGFALDGRDYRLEANERGGAVLHGGVQGTGQRNWRVAGAGPDWCHLEIDQPDGLHGFPGPIAISVRYALQDGALRVEVTGRSEGPALFAPAFHGYWNLDGSPDLGGHRLQVDADTYLPVDADLTPAGQPAPVAGTAFDFRVPCAIPRDIDHNLCLSASRRPLRRVARLEAGQVALTLETTEPGLQVYACGATTSGDWPGHQGAPFGRWAGVALEPQIWPDAANRPDFPSPRIDPGAPVVQVSRFVPGRR